MALVATGLGAAVFIAALVTAGLWATGRGPFGEPRPQADEVLGTMRDASDQSDGGGSPTRGGTILAVPATAVPDFWRRTSAGVAPAADQLSYAQFTVPTSAVPAVGGVPGAVERGGRFSLRPVAPATYLLCYAAGIGAEGYQVQGCREASLRVPGRIDARRGEAGFRVSVSAD
ncbi:hypothetical protein SAMN05444858_12319 [Micromonospora avicenniae]|uniref:Uncharacterized protein n=1 Tax=Micromonospora avicenniae TaxID=1198245 RepID=A0A1N7EF65_9ACTN|nr:hypothetical protein SAMN05444858_12319 [Micromonospora avicenniae]